MLNHYERLVRLFDRSVRNTLSAQCLEEGSPDYGTVRDLTKGYTESADAAYCAADLITACFCPESEFYRNPLLLRRASLALRHLLRRLNADGTADLMETNFHDATFNAFFVHRLGPAYELMLRSLQQDQRTEAEAETESLVRAVMEKSADAMVNGGFHTPNHRWVLSAALAYCCNTLNREDCRAQISRFLQEGIDCDENGEFTERSSGVYNIVCDRALLMLADELGMQELLPHVGRNLDMILTYFEPDFSINTLNSRRQDIGKEGCSFHAYYEPYLKMALYTGNSAYAWIADRIIEECCAEDLLSPKSTKAPMSPVWFLLFPEMQQRFHAVPAKKPCLSYNRFYEESGIVRQRIGDAALTIVRDRPLIKLQYQDKRIYLRFAGSFFGEKGQFVPQQILPDGEGYAIRYKTTADYRRPFSEKPDTPFWNDMDHSKRESVLEQTFDIGMKLTLSENSLSLTLDACTHPGDCTNVPVKLELLFQPGALFENAGLRMMTKAGDYLYQKADEFRYTYPDLDEFRVEGCFFGHSYGENMRGSLPADKNSCTVALTGLTPQKQSVRIRF